MAELPDREAWLAAVVRNLDATPDAEAEILEELAAHLDDRVADAVARGVDRAEAERRARNRLGDPAALGRDIRRARRAKRSALQLVGGGAFSFAYFSVAGVLVAVILLGILSGLTITIGGLVIHTDLARIPGPWVGLAAITIGLPWAARAAVGSVATWAPWPRTQVRAVVAAVVFLLSMPAVVLLPDQELDPWLAVLFPVVPVMAAVAALRARRGARLRPGWATVALAAAVVVAPSVALAPAPAVGYPWETGIANAGMLGRSRDATVAVVALPTSSSASVAGGPGDVVRTINFDDVAGWSDLAVQIWALEPTAGGGLRYADTPLIVAPAEMHGMTARFAYADPSPERQTWLAQVVVGIAPDGVRSLLFDPQFEQAQPWRGSVLDWWLGR